MGKISLLLLFIFIISCNSKDNKISIDEKGRENFIEFHEMFYADSLFQLQRIEFPIYGYETDGSNNTMLWDFDNWKYLKTIDTENVDFEYLPFLDMGDLVKTRLLIQKKFMIESLFSLKDGKWYMTSYSGIKDLEFFK